MNDDIEFLLLAKLSINSTVRMDCLRCFSSIAFFPTEAKRYSFFFLFSFLFLFLLFLLFSLFLYFFRLTNSHDKKEKAKKKKSNRGKPDSGDSQLVVN